MIPGYATVLAASANDRRDFSLGPPAGNPLKRASSVRQTQKSFSIFCSTVPSRLPAPMKGRAAWGGCVLGLGLVVRLTVRA
jgi:hypothetical protein